MNAIPIISVVMPVYNGGIYLEEAIDSILNQTFTDFEFIILDDGSTDDSLSLIKKYASKDDRIVIITRENKGLVYTLNEGIEKSKGDYIARMDADDISLPERFEKQIELMQKENIDICGCNFIKINEKGKVISKKYLSTSVLLNKFILCRTVPFAHGSVMIKKSFMIENNLRYGQTKFDKAEDYSLWIEFDKKGAKISNVSAFYFKYRVLENSLSKQNINSIHAYKLSKMYCYDNMKKLETLLMKLKRFNVLNSIEKEHLSYFIIKYLFSNNFFFKIILLSKFSLKINFKNIVRLCLKK
jgi:glycosyltransferase involved in cell wall biosynthesis